MKKVSIWKVTTFGKIKFCLFLLPLLIGVILTVNLLFLQNKVTDLNWENAFLRQKLEETSRAVNLSWEERAFEKEMKENLSYYLPVGYNRIATFIDLTPVDLETQKARISFLYAGKIYFVDFSYYKTQHGWHVEEESPITLKP